MSDTPFETWAILELMGHRRLAGWLTEQEIGGSGFLRLDIPKTEKAPSATQFYAPASVYAITPCTEETARRTAAIVHVEPVSEWELPRIAAPTEPDVDVDDRGDYDYLGREHAMGDS